MPTSPLAVFAIFLRLGCTSFGGPIAHLGYFRSEFVERRRWLDDRAFADLVAICQLTPGPASSKVGIALGASRGGLPGAFAAWLGFTLPSALILVAFGYGLRLMGPETLRAGWLHGLKLAAVAVVAQAVWSMGRQLCPDRTRATFAMVAAVLVLAWHSPFSQFIAILAGALAGWRLLAGAPLPASADLDFRVSRRLAWGAWVAFFALLVLLPLARLTGNHAVAMFDSFYRAGSLVFGGGHVVLPMLRAEVVPPGWVGDEEFLAGYGVAQAVPGPLFTFAAYLGTVAKGTPSGWAGGILTLVAIFLPAFFLALGPLPFWSAWREHPTIRATLSGVNAAVVGVLLGALYDPIFTTSVHAPLEFALALAAFALLSFWRVAPFWVVVFCAAGGELIAGLQ